MFCCELLQMICTMTGDQPPVSCLGHWLHLFFCPLTIECPLLWILYHLWELATDSTCLHWIFLSHHLYEQLTAIYSPSCYMHWLQFGVFVMVAPTTNGTHTFLKIYFIQIKTTKTFLVLPSYQHFVNFVMYLVTILVSIFLYFSITFVCLVLFLLHQSKCVVGPYSTNCISGLVLPFFHQFLVLRTDHHFCCDIDQTNNETKNHWIRTTKT